MAHCSRTNTGLKRKEFIEAALVCGVSTRQIILRHIVPNVLGVVVVYASLLVPSMILFESFLSFLGLGTQEPLSSWGALLSDGANSMEVTPWLLLIPAGFLVITLFCFNFIGDGCEMRSTRKIARGNNMLNNSMKSPLLSVKDPSV